MLLPARFFDDHVQVVADQNHPDAKAGATIDRLLIELAASDTNRPVRVATDEDKAVYADAYAAYLEAKNPPPHRSAMGQVLDIATEDEEKTAEAQKK